MKLMVSRTSPGGAGDHEPAQRSRILFTVVLLLLAGLHSFKSPVLQLDTVSVWLGVIAVMPWILPQIAQMISSLSVTGLFEVNFRQLQEQVEQQQQQLAAQNLAIEGGVGGKAVAVAEQAFKAAAGGTSLASPTALEEDEVSALNSADPNKGRFGGQPRRDGFRLSATVNPFPGSGQLFQIHAEVEGVDAAHALRAEDVVRFVLHPTFRRRTVEVKPSDGKASLDRVAWGGFTLGAEVLRTGAPPVQLELDLATEVPGAPAAFREL